MCVCMCVCVCARVCARNKEERPWIQLERCAEGAGLRWRVRPSPHHCTERGERQGGENTHDEEEKTEAHMERGRL